MDVVIKNRIIWIILGLTVILALLSFAGYGFYKINQMQKENNSLREAFESRLNPTNFKSSETQQLQPTPDLGTSSKKVDTTNTLEKSSTGHAFKKEVIYASQPVVTSPEKEILNEPVIAPSEVPKVTETKEVAEPIKISAVRQTSYPDGYGGTYGAYEIEIAVTVFDGEILIPLTTTNTIGSGKIGFAYSLIGGDFVGSQDSKISSCGIKRENHCVFKGDGKERLMTATVFLYPTKDDSGNYGVFFENITYYQNGERKQFQVNRKTANINIFY